MLTTEHGIFTNNEITGQTAEEVYQEWILNKDKPPQPSEIEQLKKQQADLVLELLMKGVL